VRIEKVDKNKIRLFPENATDKELLNNLLKWGALSVHFYSLDGESVIARKDEQTRPEAFV